MITFYLAVIGLIGCSLLAVFSLACDWLDVSGALLLLVMGTAIFALSPVMAGYLALFFAMSYLVQGLKKYFRKAPSQVTALTTGGQLADSDERIAKSHARDGWQVVANCGPLLIALLWQQLDGGDPRLVYCQIAVIAGAAADTWSSEIGVLSRRPPRSLLTGRPLAAGLSGGVSLLGTCAGIAAAGIIAAAWWLPNQLLFPQMTNGLTFWLPALCGFAATWIDSLLGATLQQKYRCQICGRITEKKQHHGAATQKISGIIGFNNDTVNFFSGLLTLGLAYLWQVLF